VDDRSPGSGTMQYNRLFVYWHNAMCHVTDGDRRAVCGLPSVHFVRLSRVGIYKVRIVIIHFVEI